LLGSLPWLLTIPLSLFRLNPSICSVIKVGRPHNSGAILPGVGLPMPAISPPMPPYTATAGAPAKPPVPMVPPTLPQIQSMMPTPTGICPLLGVASLHSVAYPARSHRHIQPDIRGVRPLGPHRRGDQNRVRSVWADQILCADGTRTVRKQMTNGPSA